MLLSTLFFLISSFSLANSKTFSYCFSSSTSIKQVLRHVSTVLTPKDKAVVDDQLNCLDIVMNPKREELTRKWIAKRFSISRSRGTSYPTRGQECRMKVERTRKVMSKTKKFKVGSNSGVSQVDAKGSGMRSTSLLLSSGKRGSIRYNDEFVGVKCIRGGADNYQIEIIVDGNSGGISTAISLRKGQKINIGEIVNRSKNKAKSLSLNKGVQFDERKSSEQFTYFLMIN